MPTKCAAKTRAIDLGLAIMSYDSLPRQDYTLVEIAAFCNCSPQRSRQIEQQALRKLRHRLSYALALPITGNHVSSL